MKEYTCPNCSKLFVPKYRPQVPEPCCSKACSNSYKIRTPAKEKPIKVKVERVLIKDTDKYYSKARKNWRREIKEKAVEYKGGKCERCGYNKCIGALQFHHRDPKHKEFSMSKVSKKFENIISELDKCELLCANCHAQEHYEQWN